MCSLYQSQKDRLRSGLYESQKCLHNIGIAQPKKIDSYYIQKVEVSGKENVSKK